MRQSKQKITKIIILSALSLLLIVSSTFLTGCGGSSQPAGVKISDTMIEIKQNAVNNMCNDALKLTVTGMQRRPTSIFAGAGIEKGSDVGGTNESTVSVANSNDIAIQVDVSFTWNINTYIAALEAAGASNSSAQVSTLGELLLPGTLMYVTGFDTDGNPYQSADIIVPEKQENVNALAINSQWDYDVLNSELPETSVTKTGSFLIRVPSTVSDLKLIMNTPTSGQPVDDDISAGGSYIYELPLA